MSKRGYFEVIHAPVTPQGPFGRMELRRAAEEAECRNTGWPIGVVLDRGEHGPKPMSDGILAKIVSNVHDSADYWFLGTDGSYYFSRTFVEDSAAYGEQRLRGEKVKVLAFDTRTWRVAEAFLHASKLYEALNIEGETSIAFRITHKGLKDRLMIASDPGRHIRRDRTCQEEEATWNKEIPLNSITSDLKELTFEVVSELFVFFTYAKFGRGLIDGIVDKFLSSRF